MAKKNIGATLSIKDGNFTTSIKNAITGTKNLRSHTTNATGSLKKMGTQSKHTGDSLTSLAKKALGVATAYLSFREVISIGKECVTIAQKAEEANVRLNTIMDQIPGITGKAKESVASLCKEMSNQTTIGATAQKSGASQLASFQMSAESIEKLLPQLNNLAVANYGVNVTSDQMIQAANMLGKAYSGQTGALSRAGIVMTDAQAKMIKTGNDAQKSSVLVEILNQNFGDLAKQMANTNEGRIVRLKNAINGVKSTVGSALLPAVTTIVTYAADKIPVVMNLVETAIAKVKTPLIWIKDNILPPLMSAFDIVKNIAVTAFENIRSSLASNIERFEGLSSILGNVKELLTNAFTAAQPAIIWLKDTALPGLVTVLFEVGSWVGNIASFFVNNWSIIAPIIAGVTGAIVAYKTAVVLVNIATNAMAIAQGIATAAQWAFNIALSANPIGIIIVAIGALIAIGVALWMNWDSICAWCKQAFQAVGDFFVNVGTSISSFFSGLWTNISNTVTSVWTSITGFLSGAWNTISLAAVSVFTGIGNAIKNVWNGIVGAIKGAINSIIGAINGMIRGAVSGVNGLISGINKVTGAVGIPAIPTFTAPQIPMLAQGGMIRTAGSVIVGEKGPEMLSLPQGAKVSPIDKSGKTSKNQFNINIYAGDKSAKEIINELMPQLKLALANL